VSLTGVKREWLILTVEAEASSRKQASRARDGEWLFAPSPSSSATDIRSAFISSRLQTFTAFIRHGL
jgi:hypothetical protein